MEEPERCLIMRVDPSVIVFPRTVFLGVNPVEPFIQIDIERTRSLVPDGNSGQDGHGRAVSRIGHVEHVQDRARTLEDNDPTAARLEILTPTLLFVINLQKKSMLQLSFLERGRLQRHSSHAWRTNRDQEFGGK